MRDVREGVAWLLWERPLLRSLTLAFAGVNFLFTPVFALLPAYVKDVLTRGPEWYGFLLAGAGGGAMAGAALAPLIGEGRAGVVWPLLGIGTCTGLLGANASAPLALGLLVAVGLLSGILNVKVITLLQASTPGDLRGRILAVAVALAGGTVPAGLGLGGLLGGIARPALGSLIAGCGVGIVCIAALFGMRPEGAAPPDDERN